jgi:DNA-binding transcriptional MerR regulator
MSDSEGRYKIGQAAQLLDIEPYVLRYWETEFPQLAPIRTAKGQRLYTEEHLDLIRRIKHLLYEEGMTIEGARRKLAEQEKWRILLDDIKAELRDIKRLLQS